MKHKIFKSFALVAMLMVSLMSWAAIDWSKIDYLGDGAGGGTYANKYKFYTADADATVANVQHPDFATADGIYVSFADAAFNAVEGNGSALTYDQQGAGILIHLTNFTAKETEVKVKNNAELRWTFFIYYVDGTAGAPTSEYCSYSTNDHPCVTWITDANGNVVITLSDNATRKNVAFRNGGFEGGLDDGFSVLSGEGFATSEPASTYFDRDNSGSNVFYLNKKTGVTLPNPCQIKFTTKAMAWSQSDNNNAYCFPTFVYTYGATCPADIPVTGVTLDKSQVSVPANKTVTLYATVAPNNAGDKSVSWESSNTNVATVVDGVVTPVAEGGTTITVTTTDGGFQATCSVTVTAAIPIAPSALPTAPTHAANKVKAVYSATYSASCNFADWGSGATFSDDFGKKCVTANGWFGLVDFTLNCATMEKMHADVWIEENATLRFVPIWGGAEQGVTKSLTGGQWNAIEISLTEGDWSKITDWSNIYQIKIDNIANKTIWLNNVYFYTTQTADTEKPVITSASYVENSASYTNVKVAVAGTDNVGVTNAYITTSDDAEIGNFLLKEGVATVTGLTVGTAYTNVKVYAEDAAGNRSEGYKEVSFTTKSYPAPTTAPTAAAADVKSIYSDAYTAAIGYTVGGWGQTTLEQNVELATGEHALFMSTANYQGWVTNSDLNVTGMTHVHFDVYVDAAGSIGFSPIWRVGAGQNEAVKTRSLVAGWNAIDIALSEWTGLNYEAIFQMKFADMPATCFIDNVYYVKKTVAVTGVSVNPASATLDAIGDQVQLAAVVAPADATNKNITWSSSNDAIATVSADGLVTAMANGEATITATTADGGFEGNCSIEVGGNPDAVILTSGTHKISYVAYKYPGGDYELTITSKETLNGMGGSFYNPGAVDVRSKIVSSTSDKIVIKMNAASDPQFYTPLYVMMSNEVNFGNITITWIEKKPFAYASSGTGIQAPIGGEGGRWESAQTDTEWWMVDYQRPIEFNSIKINWEGAYSKAFTLEGSNDGENFTVLYTETNQTSAGVHVYDMAQTETYRYVKINITERATQWGNSFYTFDAYMAQVSVLTTFSAAIAKQMMKKGTDNAITITAKDQYGVAMDPGTITYEITPSDAGSVTNNVFTAAKKGEVSIVAKAGEKTATAVTTFVYEGDNVAMNKSIDGAGANDVTRANDGNDGTEWQGTRDGAPVDTTTSFVIDLGAKFNVELIAIHFEGACSDVYSVETSLDNSTFATAASFSGTLGNNNHTDLFYPGGVKPLSNNEQVRYVRFTSTKSATGWGMKIFEFMAFGAEVTMD